MIKIFPLIDQKFKINLKLRIEIRLHSGIY